MPGSLSATSGSTARAVVAAVVTPLASILGPGLLVIVPVLERTLGAASVLGAMGICAVAWLIGTVVRHYVVVVEAREQAHTLDRATARLGRVANAVIVLAYVIAATCEVGAHVAHDAGWSCCGCKPRV